MIGCTRCVNNLGENYGKILIDGAIKEVSYFCCLNTYATKFRAAKSQLNAQRKELQKDIDDAAERNETRVEDGVELWRIEADAIIKEGTETSQKCFSGLHPNCIGRYQCGEKLEKKTLEIADLLERKKGFTRVARPPPKNPGIKYDAPQNFIDFKSRESKFKELVDALEGQNCYVIGLQGLGGMGKTTLAKQVGVRVAESEAFKEVVITTVSDNPNINEIRRDIAEKLNFKFEGEEKLHSRALWSRIANSGGKVLIILDDIWEKLELKDIGIPDNHKNCCVLITTRDSKVCDAMLCQPKISLEALKDRDGVDIFKKHVGKSEDSTTQFMNQAQKIVKACGGLPLAIVAIATTLKSLHVREWNVVLRPLYEGDYRDWKKVVHTSLKLSYDKLENEGKHLLLLCSLFPKDYEIPVEFLNKLGTGLSIFGEANNYSIPRERLVLAKKDLVTSFLLEETKETCVKMHDLFREVAISTEDKDVQVIMNSSGKLKSNLKFLSWSNNGFPNHFDGTKLEVLLLWIKGEVKEKDSYAVFEKMFKLRVLFVHHDKDVVYPIFSLQSFLSLKDIRTLILDGWRLSDISILKELKTLVTLEFERCLIMELPKEIVEIKSLRLLGIRRCRIEKNNPFEVIGRCPLLEELYFVENENVEVWKKQKSNGENTNKVSQDISHPLLQRYYVACSGLRNFVDDDNGLFFNTEHVENLMSEKLFKRLVEKAEILELSKMREARWKSIVPGIVSMKDGVMKDLIKLCLYNCTDIECLLDNRDPSGEVGAFSQLDELWLDNVDAKDLCLGPMPSSFLSNLKIFRLLHCKKLGNRFFGGNNITLPNLTVLELNDCPIFGSSIFRPSVARSLVQLQELCIKDCGQVETLIANQSSREEGVDAERQNSDGSLFPELKSLKIQGCGQLKFVLSVLSAGDLRVLQELSVSSCENLEYIFGEERVDTEHQNSGGSLFPELKSLKIQGCGQLKLVLSVLSAGDLPVLQELSVSSCENLDYIFGEYQDDVDQKKKYQDDGQVLLKRMLPSLTTMELETVPSFINICKEFKKRVQRGGCCCLPSNSSESMRRNEISHPADQRPLTQSWSLQNKREMTPMEWPALKHINLGKELVKSPFPRSMVCLHGRQPMLEIGDQEPIRRPCPDLMVCLRGRQPNLETWMDPMKLLMVMQELTYLGIRHSEIGEIFNLEGIKSEEPVKLKLQVLDIQGLQNLKCICKDPNKILNFCNLKKLAFSKCDQLTAIFSTSTMKNLSQLSRLAVTQCNGLVCVIKDDGGSHQLRPLKLQEISISHCSNLEFFFSISTFRTLKELKSLEIEEASSLREVFGQGDAQERELADVFPYLSHLKFKNLRKLERFCGGIDVQSVKNIVSEVEVVECGIWGKPIEAKRNEEIEEPQSTDSNTGQAMPHVFHEGTSSSVHSHLEKEAERKQEKETQGKMRALPEIEEEIVEVTRKTGEKEVFSETLSMEETMKSQANDPTPALERKASQISPAESKMTSTSLQSNAAIPNERVQEGLTSKDDAVATPLANIAPSDSLATLVTPPQSKEETKKTQANGPTPTLETKASETSPAEKMKSTSLHIGQRKKETMKQGLQENYAPEETTRIIQSANSSDLTKQPIESSLKLSGKEFAEIVQRIVKETMKQNLQENYAPEEAVRVFQSPSSDVTKQSTEPFLKLSQDFAQSTKEVSKNVEEVTATEMPPISTPFGMEFERSHTIKETRGASIEDRPMSVKPTGVTISNDGISSLHRQSQIDSASPSSSTIFETGEILELVELKDDERTLLVKTLELYPKLRLSHRHRPIIAFAYRVLIDILIMLSTKNPYTMTEADKSTLEANLGAANYFGFDKDWVESVRAKIFDMDMVDILATREKMSLMEAELELHDSALGQMRKERAESKERLAMARRKLEMAQSEFEVIDSQMLGLLVDYKLITRMVESGEASAKDGTFGI